MRSIPDNGLALRFKKVRLHREEPSSFLLLRPRLGHDLLFPRYLSRPYLPLSHLHVRALALLSIRIRSRRSARLRSLRRLGAFVPRRRPSDLSAAW